MKKESMGKESRKVINEKESIFADKICIQKIFYFQTKKSVAKKQIQCIVII